MFDTAQLEGLSSTEPMEWLAADAAASLAELADSDVTALCGRVAAVHGGHARAGPALPRRRLGARARGAAPPRQHRSSRSACAPAPGSPGRPASGSAPARRRVRTACAIVEALPSVGPGAHPRPHRPAARRGDRGGHQRAQRRGDGGAGGGAVHAPPVPRASPAGDGTRSPWERCSTPTAGTTQPTTSSATRSASRPARRSRCCGASSTATSRRACSRPSRTWPTSCSASTPAMPRSTPRSSCRGVRRCAPWRSRSCAVVVQRSSSAAADRTGPRSRWCSTPRTRGCSPTPQGQLLDALGHEHLLCDPVLRPIVIGLDGLPVGAGHEGRLATPEQRRALAHRDGGCVFPGCTAPPAWTDAHHVGALAATRPHRAAEPRLASADATTAWRTGAGGRCTSPRTSGAGGERRPARRSGRSVTSADEPVPSRPSLTDKARLTEQAAP